MHYLDIERLDIDTEENKKDSFWSSFGEKDEQIRILHYRKVSKISDIFTAPSHINPFHVTATRVRKFIPGGSKLVFIWPQTASNRGRIPNLLVPVFRTLLTGLLLLDNLHLWPGEFMPSNLPSMLPPPLPLAKCNVIEPHWSDKN